MAGALCAMMGLASCSNKAENAEATDTTADTTITEAAEATEAPAAGEAVINLAEGAKLDFEKGLPIVVDFNATWCVPCKKFTPIFDEVAAEYAGKALFYTVDIDVHPELAAEYGVESIPFIQFINPADPKANTSMLGLQTKEDFTKTLDEFLK